MLFFVTVGCFYCHKCKGVKSGLTHRYGLFKFDKGVYILVNVKLIYDNMLSLSNVLFSLIHIKV